MPKNGAKISEDQEIAQEETEIKREYFIFVPLLILIVVLISLALPDSQTRRAIELIPANNGSGYWIVHDSGAVSNYGTAGNFEGIETGGNVKIVAGTSGGNGIWAVSNRGDVYSQGGAQYNGGLDSVYLQKEAVAIFSVPNTNGYRIVTIDGTVYDFNVPTVIGNASISDELGSDHEMEIIAAASTSSGQGYWLLASNGVIFSFGDATEVVDLDLDNEQVIDITSSGNGLLALTNNGRVIALSGAKHHGDLASESVSSQLVDIDAVGDGSGYIILASNGSVYEFGSAQTF